MSELNVWNDCSPHLGHAIKRVVGAIRRYAPRGVRFVISPRDADLIIAHVVGNGELAQLERRHPEQRVVMWQYCWQTSDVADWPAVWDGCDMVATYYQLPTDNLYHTALGVDPAAFYPEPGVGKRYGIIGTGYVAETECLREAYEACRQVGLQFAHVGKDFGWGEGYEHFENVTDGVMRRLYNESYLALATRHIEGFELPAVEAAACGTPAALFDLPCYAWAKPLEPCLIWDDEPVADQLMGCLGSIHLDALEGLVDDFTPEMRSETACRLFSWARIMGAFWDEIGQRFGPE